VAFSCFFGAADFLFLLGEDASFAAGCSGAACDFCRAASASSVGAFAWAIGHINPVRGVKSGLWDKRVDRDDCRELRVASNLLETTL